MKKEDPSVPTLRDEAYRNAKRREERADKKAEKFSADLLTEKKHVWALLLVWGEIC